MEGVSQDLVRIALLIVLLNNIEILECNIQNAYLMADCQDNICITTGPKFGSEEDTLMRFGRRSTC